MSEGAAGFDRWIERGPGRAQAPLFPGDPAPWFHARSDLNDDFNFATLGGRHIIVSFLGSFSANKEAQTAFLEGAAAGRFRAFGSAIVLVTSDAGDEGAKASQGAPGVRYVFDFDGAVEALFHPRAETAITSYIIDERLSVLAVIRTGEGAAHAARVFEVYDRMAPIAPARPAVTQAPVLMIPNVFEPDFCKKLIEGYRADGGRESGFMVERDGMTVAVTNHAHKRRADWNIEDQALIAACRVRIQRRIVPEIARAFQFHASRIERNTVACYSAETGGHFARHRDNTTKGTAHRRFAVSINLNTDEYEGGDLMFAEYGRALFRPPVGAACVFSCSLLHEATPVTKGERFVFVPFLYDEAAAQSRQVNKKFLATQQTTH